MVSSLQVEVSADSEDVHFLQAPTALYTSTPPPFLSSDPRVTMHMVIILDYLSEPQSTTEYDRDRAIADTYSGYTLSTLKFCSANGYHGYGYHGNRDSVRSRCEV